MPLYVFARNPYDHQQHYAPLVAHSHRIRELVLEIPMERRAFGQTELSAILPATPNLVCLSVVSNSGWIIRPPINLQSCPPVFSEPPLHLTRLVLKSPAWFPGGFAYHQLTHLHMSGDMTCSVLTLLSLLGLCSSLEKLIIADLSLDHAWVDSTSTTISLLHLRLLTIGVTRRTFTARCILAHLLLPSTTTVRVIGAEAIILLSKMNPPSLAFAATVNRLIIGCTPEYLTIQAAGSSSSILIHWSRIERGRLFPWLDVHEWMKIRDSIARLVPCQNIQHVTISSVYWDPMLSLLPDSLSAISLCLVDLDSERIIVDHCASDRDKELVKKSLVEDMLRGIESRFLHLTELHLWSSNLSCSQCSPPALDSLEQYTFHHVHAHSGTTGPATTSTDSEQCSFKGPTLNPGMKTTFRFTDDVSWPALDLPNVRPTCHPYDW
ncbi:hypothetical protein C8Q73DRAFT_218239 [Cubamyces lactineus]|nr:hypothetical protein C8Q73DRAFT_218239 [Cubamyces lactineus]